MSLTWVCDGILIILIVLQPSRDRLQSGKPALQSGRDLSLLSSRESSDGF